MKNMLLFFFLFLAVSAYSQQTTTGPNKLYPILFNYYSIFTIQAEAGGFKAEEMIKILVNNALKRSITQGASILSGLMNP